MQGFLGFVTLAIYPTWQDSSAALAIFSIANCAVGLTNGFSALQIFAKQEYSHDMGSLRFALRRQPVLSGAACILSYFLGGVVYQKFGLKAIGYMGMIVMGSASISLGMYLFGRRSRFVEVTESPEMTSTSIVNSVSGTYSTCTGTGTGDSISTTNNASVELTTTKGGGELQSISENENKLESAELRNAVALGIPVSTYRDMNYNSNNSLMTAKSKSNSKSKLVKSRSKSGFSSIGGANKISIYSKKSVVSIQKRPSTLVSVCVCVCMLLLSSSLSSSSPLSEDSLLLIHLLLLYCYFMIASYRFCK